MKEKRGTNGGNGVEIRMQEKIDQLVKSKERSDEKVDEIHRKLIPVLDNPEASGFGTNLMETIIADNTKALESLGRAVAALEKTMVAQSDFMRWLAEEMTGKRPPPGI